MPSLSRRAMLAGSAAMLTTAAKRPARRQAATLRLRTPALAVALDAASHTIRSIVATGAAPFDFAITSRAAGPARAGLYALGDLDLRVRTAGGAWQDASTAFRRARVARLPATGTVHAAADLSALFPASFPVKVERRWLVDGDAVVLRFTLVNRTAAPVEIGGLGIAMPFDNVLTGRSLAQAHEQACFCDAYAGLDAGYVQVARLNGAGAALLVLPEPGTPLEAWAPIADGEAADKTAALGKDRQRRSLTFEGLFHWMAATAGHADREWRGAEQWNPPSSILLAPGERRDVGVRFVTAPAIRGIETALAARGRPVAVGIPGYVVPTDLDADLFVKTAAKPTRIDVHPPGALDVADAPATGGWWRYRVRGRDWGRARVTLHHADGTRQSIHYFVTRPSRTVTRDLGRFLFTRQWFERPDPVFGRSPSIMSYDRDADAIVSEEQRVWIAGLSDEGGAGAWLAAIMKQLANPDADEVAKFERFHVEVVERRLQVADGPQRDGIRKSLYWYDPANAAAYDATRDWTTWASWKRDQADSVGRSFNYVHVAAAQWVLYRLARNHVGLVRAHDWRWYLDRAARTTLAMVALAPEYAKFGQMEGSVFVALLADLRAEGWRPQAAAIEAAMRKRAALWSTEAYPFGSEMPWDSTGQEEVHAWMRRVGDAKKAAVTREAILAYDPTMPHWGYNGSARRYWDFLYAGKKQRIERQLHHYGSSLNALALFDAYRDAPADIHLLRVAYGGLMGSLTNVDRDGFGACAFHSWPDMMRFDAYSGDYGMSFLGHALGAASYLVDHPDFGWIGFGGRVEQADGKVRIEPRDSARNRLFVAPARAWITLDAGGIEAASYDPATGGIALTLARGDDHTPTARVRVAGGYRLAGAVERGATLVALGARPVTVTLTR